MAKPKESEDFVIRFCVEAYQEPRLLHERIIQPIRRLISKDTSTADGKIYGICEVMANAINFAGNYFFNLDKKHFDGLDIEGKKAVVAALRETQPLIFLEAITELNNTLLNNGLDYSDANAFNHVFTLRKNADGEVIVQANVLDGGAVRIIDRSKYEAYLQERGISSVIDQKKTGLSNIAHRLRNDTPNKSL